VQWTVVNGKFVKIDDAIKGIEDKPASIDEDKPPTTDKDKPPTTDEDKPTAAVVEVKLEEPVKHIARDSDLYETRDEDVEFLVYFLQRMQFDNIYEPMCGTGNIVRFLTNANFNVIGSDLYHYPENKKDFLDPDFEIAPKSIIISNPPFLNKTKYLDQCLKFNIPVLLFLPVNFMGTTAFIRNYKRFCNAVLLVCPRPKFIIPSDENEVFYSPKGTNCSWFFFNVPVKFTTFMMSVDKKTGILSLPTEVKYDSGYVHTDDDDVVDIDDDDDTDDDDDDIIADEIVVAEDKRKPSLWVNRNGKISITGKQGKFHLYYVNENDEVFYTENQLPVLGHFNRDNRKFDFDIKKFNCVLTETFTPTTERIPYGVDMAGYVSCDVCSKCVVCNDRSCAVCLTCDNCCGAGVVCE
jgi:hypothetical protein